MGEINDDDNIHSYSKPRNENQKMVNSRRKSSMHEQPEVGVVRSLIKATEWSVSTPEFSYVQITLYRDKTRYDVHQKNLR